MRLRSALPLALMTIVCSASGYSKGSPDLILIARGSERPLGIRDRETLKQFDPWSGQFINWQRGPAAIRGKPGDSYQIFFYMNWTGRRSDYDRGALKMIYEIWYRPGREGEPGYIYLPGQGEDFYKNNVGTILRENDDGKWHYATPECDKLMKRITSRVPSDNGVVRDPTHPAIYNLVFLLFSLIPFSWLAMAL